MSDGCISSGVSDGCVREGDVVIGGGSSEGDDEEGLDVDEGGDSGMG